MKTHFTETVILCGGEGLRFKNEFISTSKVMAPIHNKPILWHIMNQYAKSGFQNFILCVRDDDNDISQYFSKLKTDWDVKVVKTGNTTTTAGRLYKIAPMLKEEFFFVTYGDGLSDVNIGELLSYHKKQKKLITLTAVQPFHQYGILDIENNGSVSSFLEKPKMQEWVNGGFFVMNKNALDLLDKKMSLEDNLIQKILPLDELRAFKHRGFWKSIDTYKDYLNIVK